MTIRSIKLRTRAIRFRTRAFKLRLLLTPLIAFGVIALIATPVLTGAPTADRAPGSHRLAPNYRLQPAPKFTVPDVNGQPVSLADFRGKVVVLNFWATWCTPCLREIPEFNELQKKYETKGLQFLGVAMDEQGAAKVKPWLSRNTVAYPILVPDAHNSILHEYGNLSAIPVTVLIDRDGNLRDRFVGARTQSFLEAKLTKLLAE